MRASAAQREWLPVCTRAAREGPIVVNLTCWVDRSTYDPKQDLSVTSGGDFNLLDLQTIVRGVRLVLYHHHGQLSRLRASATLQGAVCVTARLVQRSFDRKRRRC